MITYETLLLAVEFGFKCAEKHHNFDACIECFKAQYPKPDAVPPWRTLDEAMQNELVGIVMEDIRDDLKYRAHDELEGRDLRDLADMMLGCEIEEDRDPTTEEIDAWIKEHVVS